MDDSFIDNAGFEPFEFELANGNWVRIVFAKFGERPPRFTRGTPVHFCAIRVYSDEGGLSGRLTFQYEFRAEHDFDLFIVPQVWGWLEALTENRGHLKYDSLDEFIEEFAEQLAQMSDLDDDAVEHLQRLPDVTDPEAFDHVDDSVFNDQNETKQDDLGTSRP